MWIFIEFVILLSLSTQSGVNNFGCLDQVLGTDQREFKSLLDMM